MKRNVVLVLLSMIFVSGCATPYKQFSFDMPAGGYKDSKIEGNRHKVSFFGNGHSKPEQVDKYWNRRANELCPNGFKLLAIEQKTEQFKLKSNSDLYIGHFNMTVPVKIDKAFNTPYAEGEIECL